VRLKREAKKKGGAYVEPESKLLFVVRIKGMTKIHPKVCWQWDGGGGAPCWLWTPCSIFLRPMHAHCPPRPMHAQTKKILQLLRLRQMNSGIFLRVNKATMGLLKLVEPFIAFGYPSLKSVKELIYKRGYAKVSGSRVPLTDNKLIEEVRGNFLRGRGET
jgi:large subunit ribosomal protein L7e